MNAGANPNFKDEFTGNTPAHFAAQDGNIPAMMVLRECGASLLEKNNDGKTPIDLIVDFLKRKESERKLGIKEYNKQECLDSILKFAIENCPYEVIDLALKAGANPNIRCNKNNDTPAHIAASLGFLGGLVSLFNHGADFSIRNNYDCAPEDEADADEVLDFFEMLKENNKTNKP